MKLVKDGDKYTLLAAEHITHIPGFYWDQSSEEWFTFDTESALKLKNHASSQTFKYLDDYELSKFGDIPAPKGMSYLNFQKEGIINIAKFFTKKRGVLLADPPRLGKTIQSIGYINISPDLENILIICPATVKLNWEDELKRWLVRDLSVCVSYSQFIKDTNIVIINYDILSKHDILFKRIWDIVICDESHKLTNPKTLRTKNVNSLKTKKRLYLTGTPILNKPKDLWSQINTLDSSTWNNFFYYAKRYCDAKKKKYFIHEKINGKYVKVEKSHWDFTGSSNLDELNTKLRTTIMVRRRREDVLKELPPKYRQIIEVKYEGNDSILSEELNNFLKWERATIRLKKRKTTKNYEDFKESIEQLEDDIKVSFSMMSKFRHQSALLKLPFIKNHVDNLVEEDNKIIIFAHHTDLIKDLHKHYKPISTCVYGEMPAKKRKEAIEKFQNTDRYKIIIVSISAALGITLSKVDIEVFAELDWVPSTILQAEDRYLEPGRTANVLIQYLVIQNSLDARIAKTFIEKQDISDIALGDLK